MNAIDRKNKLNFIIDNIACVNDDDIVDIYNVVTESLKTKNKDKTDIRLDQIKYIETNLRYINDDIILKIEDVINKIVLYEETDDEIRQRMTLKVINEIFTIIGKDRIKKLD